MKVGGWGESSFNTGPARWKSKDPLTSLMGILQGILGAASDVAGKQGNGGGWVLARDRATRDGRLRHRLFMKDGVSRGRPMKDEQGGLVNDEAGA